MTIPNSQFEGPYYNIDGEGNLGLEYRHHHPLMKKIKDVDLIENVKKLLPTISIQNKTDNEYSGFLCNETIYSKTTIMEVYGFLKMD